MKRISLIVLNILAGALLLAGCGTEENPSDPFNQFPSYTPSNQPGDAPAATPSLESAQPTCEHPYWPVRLGATWSYDMINMMGSSEGVTTWTVTEMTQEADGVHFTIQLDSPYGISEAKYLCTEDGYIYQYTSEVLLDLRLPPEEEFIQNATFPYASGGSLMFVGEWEVTVPVGSLNASRFTLLPNGIADYYWVEGVGLVKYGSELSFVLIASSIPPASTGQPPSDNEPAVMPEVNGVILNENFSRDVFSSAAWSRSDDSVSVDPLNGFLHIEPNGINNDLVHFTASLQLPLTIETRLRLVSGGRGYYLPSFRLDSTSGEENLEVTYGFDIGWMFLDYSGNFQSPVPGENTWVTLRMLLSPGSGELWAKYDGGEFTQVMQRDWSVPEMYTGFTIRQHWDSSVDVDYIWITAGLNQTNEARIRYILADIQLSGLVGYYRGFPDDPQASEAVRRWDSGIRVTNITDFERVIVAGTWQIVYAGTQTAVNGMDVLLTEPAAAPPVVTGDGFCSNPYFPDETGLAREYQKLSYNLDGSVRKSSTVTTTILSASDRDVVLNGLWGTQETYSCQPDGSIMVYQHVYLPPVTALVPGYTWQVIDGEALLVYTISGIENVTVNGTTFSALKFCTAGNSVLCEYFAPGVGQVKRSEGTTLENGTLWIHNEILLTSIHP